jgi:hypothetical protein
MASRVPVMGVPSLPTFRQARKSNAVTARCHGGGGGGSGGLRRTGGGGSGDGNGNGRGRVQRFAVNSAVALLASAVLAAPADAAPAKGKVAKGKVALPDLTHFDFAVRTSAAANGVCRRAIVCTGRLTVALLSCPPSETSQLDYGAQRGCWLR